MAVLLCGSMCWGAPAIAQGSGQATATLMSVASDSRDVIVTARRRSESMQNVPVAVTAISGADLERQGIVNVQDLRRVAPSLNISESPGSGRNMLQFTLRGQRLGDNLPSVDPSVGAYVGDQLFKRTYGLDGLIFDMQSVEVLKGPQGTLFGLNVTGGNLIFRPNLPTDEFAASVKGSVGNFDYRAVEGFINVPIADGAALRVSGQYRKRDGYVKNVAKDLFPALTAGEPDEEYMNEDGGAVRVTLKLDPTDTIQSVFTGSYAKKSGGGTGYKLRTVRPSGQTLPGVPLQVYPANSPADLVYNQQNCFGTPCAIYPLNFLNDQLAAINALGFHEIANGSYIPAFAASGLTGPRKDHSDLDYAWNIANTTTVELSDVITLKNIIGFRRYSVHGFEDVDGSLAPLLEYGFNAKGKEISEEFQILGSLPGLDWIMGAYYFRENVKSRSPGVNILSPVADAPGVQNPFRPQDNDINTSKSLFGSATANVTDALSITLGARYTWDTRKASFGTLYSVGTGAERCGFNPVTDPAILDPRFNFDPVNCLVNVTKKFDQLSYAASIDWKIAPDKLLYVAHRQGYRSGAWSTRAILSAGVDTTEPEEVKDYEVGAKFDWNLGGGAFLRTNIAAFYQDYKNIQRLTPFIQGFTTGTNFVNAQKAVIKGGELEVTFQPVSWLDIGSFAALTDAKFKEFLFDTDFDGTLDTDITDFASFGGVSKWQVGANVGVGLPVPETIGIARLQVNYYYQSAFWLQDNGYSEPGGKTPGYGLFNARLDLGEVAGTNLDAALFVNNLFDKNYVSARYVGNGSIGIMADVLGPPRMWGMELRYRF